MQASNVKIDPRLPNSRPISQRKKTELRRKAVLEFIKNQPAGTPISQAAITKLCNFNSSGSASMFMKRLAKDGYVAVDKSGQTYSYTVLNARTKKTPASVELPKAEPELVTSVSSSPTSPEARAIRAVVLEYFWHEQSDSLRKFVGWLERGGLEARK